MTAPNRPRSWREAPIDRARLFRALQKYKAERSLHPATFYVTGGAEPHWVNLRDGAPLCDCGDHEFRELLCVHALAALILADDRRVVYEVGAMTRDTWMESNNSR